MNLPEIFHNAPFVWFLIGLAFALLELAIPGLILIFFAFGAFIVSLICLVADVSVAVQIIIFVVISVASLLLFRKRLQSRFFKKKDDEFAGQHVTVIKKMSALKEGKVEYKGTIWTAKSDHELEEGEVAEITGKESIKLIVKPIKK